MTFKPNGIFATVFSVSYALILFILYIMKLAVRAIWRSLYLRTLKPPEADMTFSPKVIFWLTFASMIGQAVAGGTVHLTGLIPAQYIAPVTGWISLLTTCSLGFLSLATGYAGIGKGPLASPPTRAEASDIMTQANEAAKAQPLTPPAGGAKQ